MQRRHHSELLALASRALRGGATIEGPGRLLWDVSGNCSDPYTRVYFARPEAERGKRMVVIRPGTNIPVEVVILTRCHKCRKCALARAALWKRRIIAEYKGASRTWLGTLTIEPHKRFMFEQTANIKLRSKGVNPADLLPVQHWGAVHREILPSLQRYLKRLRKGYPNALRFVSIGELHTDIVFPHYHMLIHEQRVDLPIRHRELKAQYDLGFCTWKLVADLDGATYVAKYLYKDDLAGWARVRASQEYGKMMLPLRVNEL